jgi:hypothetical protein
MQQLSVTIQAIRNGGPPRQSLTATLPANSRRGFAMMRCGKSATMQANHFRFDVAGKMRLASSSLPSADPTIAASVTPRACATKMEACNGIT